MLPVTGAGITIGGIALTTLELTFIGVAIVVIGGAIITFSKFFPRVAVDAQPVGVGQGRLQLTVQGRPVRQSGVGEDTNRIFLPFIPQAEPGGRRRANETEIRTAPADENSGGRHHLENVDTRILNADVLRRRLNGGEDGKS